MNRCPSAEDLERHVRSPLATSRVARQIETCAACRTIVDELARDAELLTELRDALRADRDTLDANCVDSVEPQQRDTH